jgi:hypothetical protein
LERAREGGTRAGRLIGRPRVIFRRDQVAELRAQGLGWAEIARMVGEPKLEPRPRVSKDGPKEDHNQSESCGE